MESRKEEGERRKDEELPIAFIISKPGKYEIQRDLVEKLFKLLFALSLRSSYQAAMKKVCGKLFI
jgi:hypothetical protein